MLQLKTFTFNPFQENTYILYNEANEAFIFDPGCYESEEKNILSAFVEQKNLEVKMLINTHCHIDHVLGNAFVKRKYDVPFLIHKLELPVLKSVMTYASNYGFPAYEEAEVDRYLDEKEDLVLGSDVIKMLFVPGHAPGHLIFYHKDSKICIAGDTLFQGSIGRTDLPGGDHDTLLNAIKKEMFSLPDDTKVYPGHGPMTTIGYEKEYNPFVGKRARF